MRPHGIYNYGLGSTSKWCHSPPPMDPDRASINLDYTGPFPEACFAGTRYLQVSCFGGYINLQPLVSLRAEHTSKALKTAVEFFRNHGVILDTVRMDN
jgi:hypothetical protein